MKTVNKLMPPLLGEAVILGILMIVAAEVSLLHHIDEWRDDLIKSGTQTGHSPPSPSGGGSNPEVLVIGSTMGVGNLYYYPRL